MALLTLALVAACGRSTEPGASVPAGPTESERETEATCDAFVQHQLYCRNSATPAQMKSMCVASLDCAKKGNRPEAVSAMALCMTHGPCDADPAACATAAATTAASATFQSFVTACKERRLACPQLSCSNLEAASVLRDQVFNDARACLKNASCTDTFACETSAILEPLADVAACTDRARDAIAAVRKGRQETATEAVAGPTSDVRVVSQVDTVGFMGITLAMPTSKFPKAGAPLLSQPPTEVWSYPPATYAGRSFAMSEVSFRDNRLVEASFVIAKCAGVEEKLAEDYGMPSAANQDTKTWRSTKAELTYSSSPELFGRCLITLRSLTKWSASAR
jgi:hypothetical protein